MVSARNHSHTHGILPQSCFRVTVCFHIALNPSYLPSLTKPIPSILDTGSLKYKTIAFVKYVYDTAPNDLYENLVFDVCEGSRKVATGIIKSKRENIDI